MATVSFKIDDGLHAELQQLADQRKGLSVNTLCRELVVEYLRDAERDRLRQALEIVRQEVRSVHRDVVTSTYVLLLKGGRIQDRQEAKAWLDANMEKPDAEGEA